MFFVLITWRYVYAPVCVTLTRAPQPPNAALILKSDASEPPLFTVTLALASLFGKIGDIERRLMEVSGSRSKRRPQRTILRGELSRTSRGGEPRKAE